MIAAARNAAALVLAALLLGMALVALVGDDTDPHTVAAAARVRAALWGIR